MVADAAALAIPFVPGGVGIARKGLVATKIVADTVGGVDAVVSRGQSVAGGSSSYLFDYKLSKYTCKYTCVVVY